MADNTTPATADDVLRALKWGLPIQCGYDSSPKKTTRFSVIDPGGEHEREIPTHVLTMLQRGGRIDVRMTSHWNFGSAGGRGTYAVTLPTAAVSS